MTRQDFLIIGKNKYKFSRLISEEKKIKLENSINKSSFKFRRSQKLFRLYIKTNTRCS